MLILVYRGYKDVLLRFGNVILKKKVLFFDEIDEILFDKLVIRLVIVLSLILLESV